MQFWLEFKETTKLPQPVVKTWSEESKLLLWLERSGSGIGGRTGLGAELIPPCRCLSFLRLSNNTKAGREENNQSTLRNYWRLNQMHPAVKDWPKCPENSPKARDKVQTQFLHWSVLVIFYFVKFRDQNIKKTIGARFWISRSSSTQQVADAGTVSSMESFDNENEDKRTQQANHSSFLSPPLSNVHVIGV